MPKYSRMPATPYGSAPIRKWSGIFALLAFRFGPSDGLAMVYHAVSESQFERLMDEITGKAQS